MAARPWQGYYINLDRSADRRASMERQVVRAGLRSLYERFPALEGRPASASKLTQPEIGCFRSHHAVLAAAPGDARFIHVLEDDVIFSRHLPAVLAASIARGKLDAFDIIYLDTMIPPTAGATINRFKEAYDAGGDFGLIDLKNLVFLGAASYLVNQRSLARVRDALAEEIGENGPVRAVDVFYLNEIQRGRFRAALFFPYLSSVDSALSAASTLAAAPNTLTYNTLRYAFFADFDLQEARRRVPRFLVGPVPDSHTEYLNDVLRFR